MIFISKTLYDNSLGIALVLMLFFAAYFLVAKVPDKRIFANYLRSRRLMAGALLMLSANYSVHLLIAPPLFMARSGHHDEPCNLQLHLLALQLCVHSVA